MPLQNGARPASAEASGAARTRTRRRLADGLIGLSSLAIVTVYAVGYVNTSSSASVTDLAGVTPVAPAASQQQATVQPAVPRANGANPTPVPALNISYKDGTYVGRGTSRHGDIEATVVVKDGKIVSANVSRCLTRYACSYVDPLVKEMVSRQAVPVSHISGATDSSQAYKQAVSAALNKAAALS
ncbi:MAG TPA: FMN-binding protein [Dehalococcoidia bacterium]